MRIADVEWVEYLCYLHGSGEFELAPQTQVHLVHQQIELENVPFLHEFWLRVGRSK